MSKVWKSATGVLYLTFMLFGIGLAQESKTRAWEIGEEVYYFKYSEPGVMRQKGVMSGINGAYTYRGNIMAKAEARLAYGQLDYRNSGAIDNIDDFILELRGLAGYDFVASGGLVFRPYTGIGYRYLNDNMAGKISSSGAAGYERESNYFYSPIGIEAIAELGDGWFLGGDLEYDFLWRGIQKSYLSDANAAFNDLENDQDKGYGLRASIKLGRNTDRFVVGIEPFVRYWKISKSDENALTYSGTIFGFGYEPKNHTTETGVRVTFGF